MIDEECAYMEEFNAKKGNRGFYKLGRNPDYEFCVGKKQSKPKEFLTFMRNHKSKSQIQEERQMAKDCKYCYNVKNSKKNSEYV